MAYQQYNDDLANEWKGMYNKQDLDQQAWNNRYQEDERDYNRAWDEDERAYTRAWNEDERAYNRDWDQKYYDWDKEQFYANMNASAAQRAAAAAQQDFDNDIALREISLKEQKAAAKAQQQAEAEQRAANEAAAKRIAQNVVTTGMNVAMGRQPAAAASTGGNLVQTTAQSGTNNVLTQAAQKKAEYDAFLEKVDQGYSPTDADAKKYGLSDVELVELRLRAKKAKLLAAKK